MIYQLRYWHLSLNPEAHHGDEISKKLARKNWYGLSVNDYTAYERRRMTEFRRKLGKDQCYLSRTNTEYDYEGYMSPECAIWFASNDNLLKFKKKLNSWRKQRTVEFTINRQPSPQELKILDGLNYACVPLITQRNILISTEYDPRVIEFRLVTAD